MSTPSTVIVVVACVLTTVGAAILAFVSTTLRDEIHHLLRAFDRTERTLVPLVATVRTDRDRLAERLEGLTHSGSGTSSTQR